MKNPYVYLPMEKKVRTRIDIVNLRAFQCRFQPERTMYTEWEEVKLTLEKLGHAFDILKSSLQTRIRREEQYGYK